VPRIPGRRIGVVDEDGKTAGDVFAAALRRWREAISSDPEPGERDPRTRDDPAGRVDDLPKPAR
jgi:hypothetical protein